MRKTLFMALAAIFMLASCNSDKQTVSTNSIQSETGKTQAPLTIETPKAISTITPSPLPSATLTSTATPMGGKPLRVAYFGFNCEEVNAKHCIIIDDFFVNAVKNKIPLSDKTVQTHLSWSPDGRYLLYSDWKDNYLDIMLFDMTNTESISIGSDLLLKPTSEAGDISEPWPNRIAMSSWSPTGEYLAYKTGFSEEDHSVYILSIQDQHVDKISGYYSSFYWLNDGASLVEIKTGNIYNARDKQISTIQKAYFMNITSEFGQYLVSTHGDDPSVPDQISIFPYVKDLSVLSESGTKILYENEILFATIGKDSKRTPKIGLDELFTEGDEVIFSGVVTYYEPYEQFRYLVFGTMSDIPFEVGKKDFVSDKYAGERIILLSPDGTWYIASDPIWLDHSTQQTILKCYDMNSHELLHTYDLYQVADNPHEILYLNHMNLAFFWEE